MNEIRQSESKEQFPASINDIANIEDNNKYLTFYIDGGVYGVGISCVKEIIEYPSVTRVPMTENFIRGVINLRGNVVPVIDLAVRLEKDVEDTNKRTCVIIVELVSDEEKIDVGFVVDAVNEVVDIPDEDIESAPAFGSEVRADFISGIGKRDKKFVVLLALANVLSIDELAELSSGH